MTRAISALSLSMIGFGVLAGAKTPNQALISKVGELGFGQRRHVRQGFDLRGGPQRA
jgi:hypothetical protein